MGALRITTRKQKQYVNNTATSGLPFKEIMRNRYCKSEFSLKFLLYL
jgi:hypothetical protein